MLRFRWLISRTAKEFDSKRGFWLTIPRVWYSQCQDLRVSTAMPTTMLPQHGSRTHLLEPISNNETLAKDTVEISHKRQAQGVHGYACTHMACQAKSLGSSKSSALRTPIMDKELSASHDSQIPKSRRQFSQLDQVRVNSHISNFVRVVVLVKLGNTL